MKEIAVLRAQTAYILGPGQLARLPILDIVEGLKERYSFKTVPEPAQLLQPAATSPGNFIFGKFGDVTIEFFQVLEVQNFGTALAATCRTSTDDATAFLDDLLKWIAKSHRIERKGVWPPQFLSQMEVEIETTISTRLEAFRTVGDAISNLLRSYGQPAEYEPIGVSLHCDPSKTNIPVPAAFVFERRTGIAYDSNHYYSQAPLKTSDHRAVIQELERLVS
jgi:hypothetical protein